MAAPETPCGTSTCLTLFKSGMAPVTLRLPVPLSEPAEIANLPSGAPVVVLHGGLKTWFEAKGLQAKVTLSDESDYAVSFCIVEAP